MASDNTLSSCSDANYVFQSFDHLASCYNANGGTGNNSFVTLVSTCINDYCQSPYSELGGCGKWNGNTSLDFEVYSKGSTYFVGYEFFWNNATCDGVSNAVNSDIAGPGVWVAYLMQAVMICYFWLFLRMFRLVPALRSLCSRKKQRSRKSQATSQARTAMGKIGHFFYEHDLVLQAIVVEFQEAQCFFMLASQAAILGAKRSNGVFDSYTLRSLWANNGVAGLISSAGVLPVIMGMWSLQKMRMNSPWMFFLSAGTVILSEFALYWTNKFPSPDQLVPMEYSQWPASCGGLAPPLIYCPDQDGYAMERVPVMFFWRYLNPYCLTVFGLVVIHWFISYIAKLVYVRHLCETVLARLDFSNSSRFRQFLSAKRRKWRDRLPNFLTIGVEVLFLVAMAVDFVCFAGFDALGVIDWGNWSFGQIVAITMWFPVISKYIYWNIFGTESYSEARVPEPYHIVREKQKDDDSEDVEFEVLPSSYDTHGRKA